MYSLANIGFKTIEKMANGSSGQIELNLSTIENIAFVVPDIAEQQTIITQINEWENKIAMLEGKMANAAAEKAAVLAKYL